MRITIRDPQGYTHVVAFEDYGWHGYENIAHGWEPSQRQVVIEAVLAAARYQRSLPLGFRYATQN